MKWLLWAAITGLGVGWIFGEIDSRANKRIEKYNAGVIAECQSRGGFAAMGLNNTTACVEFRR